MTRAPLAALALLLVAACSSGAAPRSTGSSASSSGAAPTASTASSSAASSSSSAAPAVVCDAPPRPAGAVRVTEGQGDVDGDGQPDALGVYADGTAASPGPWHVLVELGGGRGRMTALITDAVAGDGGQRVGLLGASEITPGRAQAVFVAVGSGASATVVGVFVATGCTLSRLTLAPGGAPTQFPVGGAVTHLGGLRCLDQRLEQMSATSTDGITYSTSIQRLALGDGALRPDGPPRTGTLAASDPALADFSTLTCPGVSSP